MGGLWAILGGPGALWAALGGPLGVPGAVVPCSRQLWKSWKKHFFISLPPIGRTWEVLGEGGGASLERTWAVPGDPWCLLGGLWVILELRSALWGALGGPVGVAGAVFQRSRQLWKSIKNNDFYCISANMEDLRGTGKGKRGVPGANLGSSWGSLVPIGRSLADPGGSRCSLRCSGRSFGCPCGRVSTLQAALKIVQEPLVFIASPLIGRTWGVLGEGGGASLERT